jgi:FkbM family methyltransferase
MNSYSLGLAVIRRLFRVPALSGIITPLARIWLRHFRWRAHLRAFQFDGVVDGGANVGEFAQVVRDTLPRAHLLCVEPHPACADQLRKQGFEVIEAALWNEKTTLDLFQNGPSTASTVVPATPGDKVARVETVRLADLPIRGERLLIKLDLQGAEPAALQALGDLEKRCAGFLVEVSLPPAGSHDELNRFFLDRGYTPFASVNELFSGDRQIEADLLWIRRNLL